MQRLRLLAYKTWLSLPPTRNPNSHPLRPRLLLPVLSTSFAPGQASVGRSHSVMAEVSSRISATDTPCEALRQLELSPLLHIRIGKPTAAPVLTTPMPPTLACLRIPHPSIANATQENYLLGMHTIHLARIGPCLLHTWSYPPPPNPGLPADPRTVIAWQALSKCNACYVMPTMSSLWRR